MAEPTKLRIAIIGSGIAGLAAAIGLQKHGGIDIQMYERAAQLQEIGASIALGPNGMRTLERLGVVEALDDDVAFRNRSGSPMIYKHWKTNEIVSVDSHHGNVEYRHRTSRFYRAHLQQALHAYVDPSRIHLGKSFVSLSADPISHELTITFADGSTTCADILLGADGIQSAVRRFFIPSSAPKWTGWVAFRSVFEAKLVEHIPGVLDEATHWWGPETTFFASRLGKDLFTVVGGYHSDSEAANAPYKDSTWNSDADVNFLKEYYKDWHPVVRQMIDATPHVRAYPNTFASSLDTWVHGGGKVTYAGDAAHAHGGAFAAGGSLALDDAYAFVSAIWHVYPPGSQKPGKEDVSRALRLYERTRKTHTDRVLSTVYQNNKRTVERLGAVVETDEQLRKRMSSRADPSWIHEHDVVAAFAKAVAEKEEGPAAQQARL